MVSLLALAAWIYLLSALRRARLIFFRFLVGAAGFFFFAAWLLAPHIVEPMGMYTAAAAGVGGRLTGFFSVYPADALVFVGKAGRFISFYIDYECSGVIEILAFLSLLLFFPVYSASEKAVLALAGAGWIFLSNALRIFIICVIIYFGGNDVFYFAHTVFGRIVFYGLSVALYFRVFTRAQVVRQQVGRVVYADKVDE